MSVCVYDGIACLRSVVHTFVCVYKFHMWTNEKKLCLVFCDFFFLLHRKLIQPWLVQRRKNISLLLLLHMYYHWPHLHSHIRITIIIIIILFFAFFFLCAYVCFYCISKRHCVANIARGTHVTPVVNTVTFVVTDVSLNICNLEMRTLSNLRFADGLISFWSHGQNAIFMQRCADTKYIFEKRPVERIL